MMSIVFSAERNKQANQQAEGVITSFDTKRKKKRKRKNSIFDFCIEKKEPTNGQAEKSGFLWNSAEIGISNKLTPLSCGSLFVIQTLIAVPFWRKKKGPSVSFIQRPYNISL